MVVHRKASAIMELLKGAAGRREVVLSTVSGVCSTKPAMIRFFDHAVPAIRMITTKSFQVLPNSGNREPIIAEPYPGDFGNSVGLRNPGLDQALKEVIELRRQGIATLLNISVSASNPEDFTTLVKAFGPYADLIELNFSCPHASAGYGSSIGGDAEVAAMYMAAVRAAAGRTFPALIIPKLTPNVADIGAVAQAVMAAGADGLSAVNTFGPVRYTEPHSGQPILNNSLAGRGGQSGGWIFDRSIAAIRSIRQAVGPDVLLLGMGGVSTGEEAAAMVQAGADTVGIGSALGRVHQKHWPAYLQVIKDAAERILYGSGTDGEQLKTAAAFLRTESAMQYTPHVIEEILFHTPDTAVIRLGGAIPCSPGEYAFIWLPDKGEKPFSIAGSSPLTFVIKARGAFTRALLASAPGDTVYIRGLYGAEVQIDTCDRAVLVAGGTGIAVLPSLAGKLHDLNIPLEIYHGTSEAGRGAPLLYEELSSYGPYHSIPDDGIPGRVLESVPFAQVREEHVAWYLVGPELFMSRAAALAVAGGASPEAIMLSMERPSLCGIGMCGECACGERLTCQYGTFISYACLQAEAPELLE